MPACPDAAPAAPIDVRLEPGWGPINVDRTKFMPLTFDVFAALFHLDANASERKLIHYILHWSWGDVARRGRTAGRFRDAQACLVNVAALARLWKVSRAHLNNAKADLIRDGIIVPLGDGYTINKHADRWSASRISPESVKFARACVEFAPEESVPKRVHVSGREHGPERVHNGPSDRPRTGTPPGPERVHMAPAAYRNAGASEDSQKTPEDNSNSRAGGFHPQELETPSRPVERHEGLLASDELPPAPGPAGPLPPPAPPGEDDRLALWCKAEVDRVYPDNEMHGEAIFRGVRQWRLAGVERHVIAAFVADACGVSFRSIRTDVPRFVGDKIRRYRPEEGHPVVPAEWAPAVAGPEFFRGSEEFRAKRREAEARRRERVAREGYPAGAGGPLERARAQEWESEHLRRCRQMAGAVRAS
jgi:hypothetical protein